MRAQGGSHAWLTVVDNTKALPSELTRSGTQVSVMADVDTDQADEEERGNKAQPNHARLAGCSKLAKQLSDQVHDKALFEEFEEAFNNEINHLGIFPILALNLPRHELTWTRFKNFLRGMSNGSHEKNDDHGETTGGGETPDDGETPGESHSASPHAPACGAQRVRALQAATETSRHSLSRDDSGWTTDGSKSFRKRLTRGERSVFLAFVVCLIFFLMVVLPSALAAEFFIWAEEDTGFCRLDGEEGGALKKLAGATLLIYLGTRMDGAMNEARMYMYFQRLVKVRLKVSDDDAENLVTKETPEQEEERRNRIAPPYFRFVMVLGVLIKSLSCVAVLLATYSMFMDSSHISDILLNGVALDFVLEVDQVRLYFLCSF